MLRGFCSLQIYPKATPLPFFRFDPDAPAHFLDDFTDDRQADAGASVVMGEALEHVEDAGLGLF